MGCAAGSGWSDGRRGRGDRGCGLALEGLAAAGARRVGALALGNRVGAAERLALAARLLRIRERRA